MEPARILEIEAIAALRKVHRLLDQAGLGLVMHVGGIDVVRGSSDNVLATISIPFRTKGF